MRWEGLIPIAPATFDFGPVNIGQQVSTTMEAVPSNGDLPRPFERWQLTNLNCPIAVMVRNASASVTQVSLILSLVQRGVPVYLTSQIPVTLTPGPSSTNSSGNGVISADLVNPILLRAGESPLLLNVSATPAQQLNAGGHLYVAVGRQVSTIDSLGNVTAVDQPGAVHYQAYSINEVNQ